MLPMDLTIKLARSTFYLINERIFKNDLELDNNPTDSAKDESI